MDDLGVPHGRFQETCKQDTRAADSEGPILEGGRRTFQQWFGSYHSQSRLDAYELSSITIYYHK